MEVPVKRIIAYIAFAALFCAVLAQAAHGAFSPKEVTESVYLDVLETDYWTGEDGVNSIYKRTASGVDILSVSASPDAKYLSLYGEFDPLDLSSYSEIGMNIAVRGEDSSYPVTVTLYSETQSVEFKYTVSADHSQIYFPIS